MKSIAKRLTPAKDRMTVKNSVDNPKMMPSVPIMENRSFHRLILSNLKNLQQVERGLYSLLFNL